jgi:hypothetical protein
MSRILRQCKKCGMRRKPVMIISWTFMDMDMGDAVLCRACSLEVLRWRDFE